MDFLVNSAFTRLFLLALLGVVSSEWRGIEQLYQPEYKDDPEPLVLHRDKANNFRTSHGRQRRDLWEECYSEGCSKEEVEEVVGGHALHQYYYGWRCMKLYGGDWTYSGNPHRQQCCNCIRGVNICSSGSAGYNRGSYRNCYFGNPKNVYAVYMENGCNDGELANWRLNFDDPSRSVRYVYNVGCRERKVFSYVRGARSYRATLTGGGGGDGRISNYKLGWFGYNSRYCGNPGSPANGYKSGDNYYETSKVYFYCHYGFTRVGSAYRTCQSWGWDGSVPSCKRLCRPGQYSPRGYDPCSPCPIGQYQPNTARTSCTACPSGKSTSQTGSKFASDCHHKCSKVLCHLQQWTSWADLSSPVGSHCASQARRRYYTKTWQQILDPSGCHNVPKTCPSDKVENREKVVYCDALPKPAYGYYSSADCSTTRQKCKKACLFYCNSHFQRQGSESDFRRVCKPNGHWTYSNAYCKDITAPTISCPSTLTVNNDRGKAYARVNIPLATASDNTGNPPSVKISSTGITPIYDFPISSVGTEVRYTATDGVGLSATCRFFVKVKDAEKPEVLSCPSNHTVFTEEQNKRIVFPEPKFKDNYDPAPAIKSSHSPGAQFPWGSYDLVFNATDKAGNMASCSYKLQVGPLRCPFYDPPANGIRSCNIKLSNVLQEFVCTVQCHANYDFVTVPKYSTYVCKETGEWHGYANFFFEKLKAGKPWPDCALKSSPTGIEKKATVYVGSCLSANSQTQEQIKQSFIKAINADPMMAQMLCMASNNVDCKLSNVKVYCGKNSKRKRRGLSEDTFVISFGIDIMDLDPSSHDQEERLKLQRYADKIAVNAALIKTAIKRAAALAVKVSENDVDVEDGNITGACVPGKVLVIKSGSGSDIQRSECVNCGVGTAYNLSIKSCVPCSVGSYQDNEGQEYCKVCPAGTSTVATGTSKLDDCKGICRSGESSLTGLETCIACAVGTYQPNNHSTSCLLCPTGTSTLHIATNSQEECKKYCVAGYSSSDNGLGACIPCPRGSYQPHAKGTSCITCPPGSTTVDDGATSRDQCKASCGMDFEHGISHWTKTGTAFNNQPTYGDNPAQRRRESAQQQGNWWIGGYENRPSSSQAAGQTQGDGPVGTLTSPSFRISGQLISFLIGGGCDINKERVELLVDGNVVRRCTGKCFESMERTEWSVSEYQGRIAQIRLVDSSSGGWGHINFDDLRGDTCI